MARWRLTIAGTMVLVSLAAVAFATLRHPSQIVNSAVYTAAVTTFVISVVVAFNRRGRRSAIWFGFSAFGISYLALSRFSSLGPFLLTDALIDYVRENIRGPEASGMLGRASFAQRWLEIDDDPFLTIHQIIHSLVSLILAVVGGLFAAFLTRGSESDAHRADHSRRSNAEPPETP